MIEEQNQENSQNQFSKEHKIGLVLLSLFAVLAVGLGILQIRNNAYRPFALNNSIPPFLNEEINTEEALRYRDTDLDGLNDFDELYIYSTSPYLEDTDSDGVKDKEEIDKGRNPLCYEGKNCGFNDMSINASSFPAKQDNVALYGEAAPQSMEEYLQNPDTIRELLLTSGLSQELVNKLTDDDLKTMAGEIFASTTLMTASSTSDETDLSATAEFINDLMNK
ncbi:MAG: hypothetical protein COU29_00525 [Candidatus Magasanikbacteria bacterium CG10_big_fil_rev_8_21_14_0_10_36_32]|uniref:Uncharacterized protein n=1 Tax=Candidatus Magasanikbacteria bacterium CG10_big_fil_rev_8_21_14_0_10_36_32 TaxID=1974646 RepID=A0A2M6W7D6_9BACT|nr:MAG: hypothetical protein COU29_00525 [Candidatus Magasanikbacteria bacterium CG10_big_fil_rev_8_21_14_0_10_36_32]